MQAHSAYPHEVPPSGPSAMFAEGLRARLPVDVAAERLQRFFAAATDLMKVMARACGHNHLNKLNKNDIATWHREMARLSGIHFSGLMDPS